MKLRLLLLFGLLALLYPNPAQAQLDVYGVTSAGMFMENCEKPTMGIWVGGDIPYYTDTERGIVISNRPGVFLADRDPNIKGASDWLVIIRKSLGLWNKAGLYGCLGSGVLYQMPIAGDAESETEDSWKFALGVDLKGGFGFSLGADVVTREEWQYFVYASIDLTKPLLR